MGRFTRAKVARAGVLKIGNVKLRDPLVYLSTNTRGNFAATHPDGNIGGRVLKRFTVTFDYGHQLAYFKPNRSYREPMKSNRSGQTLDARNGDFVVTGVMAGSPASQAGITNGDIVTAVGGKPAAKVGINVFTRALQDDPPGARLTLNVENHDKARVVTLILHRLIPETAGFKAHP